MSPTDQTLANSLTIGLDQGEGGIHLDAVTKSVQYDAIAFCAPEEPIRPFSLFVSSDDHLGVAADPGDPDGELLSHGQGSPWVPVSLHRDL
jgi:hypothetical protein